MSTMQASAAVGQGFTLTPADLAFILKQIKIGERHSRAFLGTDPAIPANPSPTTDPNYCQSMVGSGVDQIPDRLTTYGLRTVDGSCNNLFPGRDTFAAADQVFPRLTAPKFISAEPITSSFPVGPPGPTTYAQKTGNVVDSRPRVISNLIVDQTSTNPAALAAAQFPIRSQQSPTTITVCTTNPDPTTDPPTDGVPTGCVPTYATLDIPNITTDVGLSPPFNSWFTFFGQFFDHGVDQTVKSGSSVFVPLKDDDPLIAGPDHILVDNPNTPRDESADNLPPSQRFMVLTRAQNQPGPDGVLGTSDDVQNASNTDSPWVDQSQTYTSHASHQVFLREYAMVGGVPVSTGKLLAGLPAGQTYPGSADGTGGISTWAAVKQQAHDLLGLRLVDRDATNVPMLAVDPYGKFVPGPLRGLPQYVTASGLVEGQLDDPLTPADETVLVPADAKHFDTPFLTDIAHNADPSPADTDHNPATPPVAPTPDTDTVASADFASQPPGTYDDEMLNAHFACGDGRCNENIALSTVHQIFHSEHDRLVDDIKRVLTNDTTASGVTALAQWKLATGAGGWNGERLFQAARFVTEMEYQHLVFEEFARKIQPAIRPFHVYTPDINPAVKAEFAHAVYRFGHSMLDDEVSRKNPNGSFNSLPLLKAFLNPPEFFNNKGTPMTAEAAAGSVIMGSVDQVGNEIDEFVIETLRNNLLGLPLDLPTINMTRAREAGVPPLNVTRRQIHADTNDAQLAPYTSWADFGQNLKHQESLVNFVAAYGKHPSIVNATTVADKRAAAKLIVDPAVPTDPAIPPDAPDFLYGFGAYASPADSGVDDIDLWVGGLAEKTNLFGGLLGSTFNYVFQNQLESLQDGDRLYYLARTPGLNLRTQLEGNSFAEMIQRNTTGTVDLKADVFATADCKFLLENLAGTPAGFAQFGSTVADDPTTTDCDESLVLLRKPDGTIQYKAINPVDPPGINGQSVYQGTAGVDRVYGGNDNDTFWGDAGDDVIEGNGGDDVALGGDGNDRITDLDGADVLKGGPGNDYINGGPGDDIAMGGDGSDFIDGGSFDNETFAGPGNDFIIAGQGADAVFGDSGDDWIEGGTGQDLLQGDHGAPFFDDPGQTQPGNDVFVGQAGENDYDAEGGDDIMSQNAAIDRNAGAGGFDWASHQYDTVGADDDMAINNFLPGLPIQVVVNRDRWQETEANSGSAFNDVIKGDDNVPAALGGAGFTGCNVIDQAGVDRVAGLNAILPQPLTGDPAPVVANSAAGFCPTTGPIWGEGNVLIGGPGSDTITGRGADDVIDGDRYLQVRISVRTNPADPGTELGSTDLMEGKAKTGNFGPGTTDMTLQQAVFAGIVDPGNLVIVREIKTDTAAPDCGATAPVNCDTAVFAGPLSNYTIAPRAASGTTEAAVVVTQTGANVVGQKASDGIDTLRNIEQLQFSDQTVQVTVPAAPTNVTAAAGAPGTGTATVSWTPPAANGGPATTSFEVVVSTSAGVVRTITGLSRTATSTTVTGLTIGTAYTFQVRAVNDFGPGALSAPSNAVTPPADTAAPTVTATSPTAGATSVPIGSNVTATFSKDLNAATVTGTTFTLRVGTLATGTLVGRVVTYDAATRTATLNPNANLAPGTLYTARLRTGITDTAGNPLAPVTWSFTVDVAPTVSPTTPLANATGVSRTANITATFSKAVTNVTNTTVRLQVVATGVLIGRVVTLNAAGTVVTLNPNPTLAANTQYRVTLTNGIRDLLGTPLTTTSYTFTTGP
ncbi:MAG TPA: peroxidase family protein [Dermatophilaceae bacterium]|nr:peroxidase family protein [Dermatophilaceae bacterium]